MFTFKEVVDEVAPEIGTGYDPDSEYAKKIVKRAILQIMQNYPIMLEKIVRLYAYGNYFVLPDSIRTIKAYVMNGVSERPQNIFYEFIDNGPGLLKRMTSAHNVITDNGYTPVFFQPPAELPIEVMSDRDEESAVIIVRGNNDAGKEVRSANGTSGESIQLLKANELVKSRLTFKEITAISKPKTRGYIHLYSYDAENDARYLLARYSPDSNVCHFKKYRIPGNNFTSDQALVSVIDALVLMEAPKYLDPTDIVPIRDLMAIQFIARALHLMKQMKYKEAQFESQTGMELARASLSLDKQTPDYIDIDADSFMFGSVETL